MNKDYAIFYKPSQHLAVDEVIVKYKYRVIFRQYIPIQRKCFSIKMYKLCDESGYTYDMTVYLGRDSHSSTDDMTAVNATVINVTCRVEGLGHNIFMDNFFSFPRLLDDWDRSKINSRMTVRPNRKYMPRDFGPKQMKLKRGDIRERTRGSLTAALYGQDRREVYMLTNTNPPPAEGNFCDDCKCPMKLHTVQWYNWHIGYVENSGHMANTHSMSRRTFKWTTKLYFSFLDLTVLNSWILLSSCGAKYTHQDFRLLLVRNLIEEAGKSKDCLTPRLVGSPCAATTNVV
jgi:hypothetical protein